MTITMLKPRTRIAELRAAPEEPGLFDEPMPDRGIAALTPSMLEDRILVLEQRVRLAVKALDRAVSAASNEDQVRYAAVWLAKAEACGDAEAEARWHRRYQVTLAQGGTLADLLHATAQCDAICEPLEAQLWALMIEAGYTGEGLAQPEPSAPTIPADPNVCQLCGARIVRGQYGGYCPNPACPQKQQKQQKRGVG